MSDPADGSRASRQSDRLTLEGVAVRFGGVTAIEALSMSVPVGEIRGLIGPNGAGKTTAINAITGAVPVSGGVVRLDGEIISGLPAHLIGRHGVARTFQHVEPFADQTVLTNVLVGVGRHAGAGFFGTLLGLPAARRRERESVREAEAILEAFDLAAFREARASELPFGVLKRMDLARALGARPRLLLLDEPTSGMSEAEADRAIATVRELARRDRVTLVVIEHNMRVMMALADRVTVMQYGAVIAEGTPAEIQRNPQVVDAYLGEEAVDAVD
ncbi:MAG: ABC transporter ATP-binding protein [Lautropia sp.]